MGFDLSRIDEEVDEELKCGICRQLLENPVILSECDHLFCQKCLDNWLSTSLICPIDFRFITKSQIKCAPKMFQNFIKKYGIKCDYYQNGCKTVIKVDKLDEHSKDCPFKSMAKTQTISPISDESEVHKRLESLDLRVKSLENENKLLAKLLEEFKKVVLNLDLKKELNTTSDKLMVKIDDKNLMVEADINEPIERIKRRVQQMVDLESEEMLVYFANQELNQNLSLSDYRINKLTKTLFLSMVRKKMRISVKIDKEREYAIKVSPNDKVEDVLPMVLRKEVLEMNQIVVTYRNQHLDEKRTLFSYRIREGNYIFLNTKPLTSLQV